MSSVVLDTHAIIWYLQRSPSLSNAAHIAIKSAIASGGILHIPAVSLVEIVYLEEKGRVISGTYRLVIVELSRPDSAFAVAALDVAVVDAMHRVPRDMVPDMPDRIVAATAFHLGLPLVTADAKIRASSVPTIW